MSDEEFYKRMINKICKDYAYDVATNFELLFLKKQREINNLEEKIDKAIEYIKENATNYVDKPHYRGVELLNIEELLEILGGNND